MIKKTDILVTPQCRYAKSFPYIVAAISHKRFYDNKLMELKLNCRVAYSQIS